MNRAAPGTLIWMKKTYHGSCLCGAIRFECDLDLATGTTRCNCSFCKKARFWFTLVKPDAFRLLHGAELLTDYQRTVEGRPRYLHFGFCSRCGLRPFTQGGGDVFPTGGDFYAVNVASLDDASDEELATAPIHFADGRHDDWKAESAEHRYL
jgi:hypothetical protein